MEAVVAFLVWLRSLVERPPAITDEQQWDQWRKDVERIYRETVYVFRNRLLLREIRQMFQQNAQLQAEGGYIWRWLFGMYGRDMVLAVGREVDKHPEVVNLIQLMSQMTKRPKVISRERFLKRHLKAPAGPD